MTNILLALLLSCGSEGSSDIAAKTPARERSLSSNSADEPKKMIDVRPLLPEKDKLKSAMIEQEATTNRVILNSIQDLTIEQATSALSLHLESNLNLLRDFTNKYLNALNKIDGLSSQPQLEILYANYQDLKNVPKLLSSCQSMWKAKIEEYRQIIGSLDKSQSEDILRGLQSVYMFAVNETLDNIIAVQAEVAKQKAIDEQATKEGRASTLLEWKGSLLSQGRKHTTAYEVFYYAPDILNAIKLSAEVGSLINNKTQAIDTILNDLTK